MISSATHPPGRVVAELRDERDRGGEVYGAAIPRRRMAPGSAGCRYRITRNPPRMNGCTRQK
jgi:hypothetical protein